MTETTVIVLFALAMLVAGLVGLRERPAARRQQEIARWARENLVSLTPATAHQLDRVRVRRARAAAWSAVALAPLVALASVVADSVVLRFALLGVLGVEPARDPGELYAQDVWRADLAQSGYRGIIVCAALAMTSPGFTDPAGPALGGILFGTGAALMVAALVSTRFPGRPAKRVRRRLWPELRANELIRATPVAVLP
jgi:hypothetical protein